MNKIKIPWGEKVWYCIWCVLTLGLWYTVKCTIKIAIAECENSKEIK